MNPFDGFRGLKPIMQIRWLATKKMSEINSPKFLKIHEKLIFIVLFINFINYFIEKN